MKKFVKQKGSAMISALLMMSIVTVISVAMISRQDIEIRRTESVLAQERLLSQIAVVELWGIETLRAVAKQLTPEADYITLEQQWTKPLPEFEQEGVWLSGQIFDLQALFNINDILVDLSVEEVTTETTTENPATENQTQNPNASNTSANQANNETTTQEQVKKNPFDEKTPFTIPNMFARLLIDVAKLKKEDAIALSEVVWLWAMPESNERDKVYLEANIPYRAAHQPFVSVSELRLVQGMNNDIYNALQPYISAIPLSIEPTPTPSANMVIPVNVNTTEASVIAAIANINLNDAKSIMSARPYFDTEAIQNQLAKIENSELDTGGLMKMFSVTSNYFLVRAYARDEKRQIVQYSILHRGAEGKVQVLRRVQGEM